ncbi:PREDICTED: nuclear speckle splicing regulatory protein 1 [Nicrophorus vespilloides]|uniref:Nuclear speckle splicing regulatory protein 1 n=1 Tax=Nicrophorus vespilloides TaxID=110193 RepID=A0ABM1N3N8_NICVS|nr:PREDICTED: nuclear speckle splicing regulatory protein 1 [Nicrophorus vespilloides]
MDKEYGLIVKNKLSAPTTRRPAIFEEDSDSDGGSAKPTGLKKPLKRQDRVVQEKALEEDPTVFQYDELYDDMDKKRNETKLANKDVDKKPKYIKKLLIAAERRKLENERRIERQVQKEREEEGDEFRDKEAFVTASYKKKLEEMKELEEKEAREAYLESIGDCTKQIDGLDGFYRHLYSQVNDGKKEEEDGQKDVEDAEKIEVKSEDAEKAKKKTRKYRKREDSKSDEEEVVASKAHLQSNVDADSDFSIDSESEGEEKDVKVKEVAVKEEKEDADETEEKKEKPMKEEQEEEEEPKPKKPKIDIWKKRTVGEVFDEALKRFYERKTLRESG